MKNLNLNFFVGVNVIGEKWYMKKHILLRLYGFFMTMLGLFGTSCCIADVALAGDFEERLLSILSVAYGSEVS